MDPYILKKEILIKSPIIHPSVYIAAGAHIISDVELKEQSSIWFNTVLRGDINRIVVGIGSNIQDGSIVHVTNNDPCIVSDYVTIGHHVNLHACTIEDKCLVGIGAIVLSGAVIKKGSIIAAGSVVKENTIVEEGSLMAGVPAKKIKQLGPDAAENNFKMAKKYMALAEAYRQKQRAKN